MNFSMTDAQPLGRCKIAEIFRLPNLSGYFNFYYSFACIKGSKSLGARAPYIMERELILVSAVSRSSVGSVGLPPRLLGGSW